MQTRVQCDGVGDTDAVAKLPVWFMTDAVASAVTEAAPVRYSRGLLDGDKCASSTTSIGVIHMVPQVLQVPINRLVTYSLRKPIACMVEPDDDEWLAQVPDIPQVFGLGKTTTLAVQALMDEIESLYDDLLESDDFTPDWLALRSYLKGIIEPR